MPAGDQPAQANPSTPAVPAGDHGAHRWAKPAALAFALLIGVALVLRVMSFPLSHDEQGHVTAGSLLFREPLYGALGYNHLPGLPLLLAGMDAITGGSYLLLAGRILIALCWLATAALLRNVARDLGGGDRLAAVALLVLAAGTLLGPAGMLVTNNFLPIPFALFATHQLIRGLDRSVPQPRMILVAGAAAGFAVALKISYLFLLPPFALAALLRPSGLRPVERWARVVAPLVAGGAIGGAPALVVLADDPAGLYRHTVRYFTAGHLAYWQHAPGPKAMALTDKLVVAGNVWLSGSGLLALLLVGIVLGILVRQGGRPFAWWPVPFTLALVLLAAAGAFLPTPAFPQYFEPPVPFLILLFLLLHSRLSTDERHRLRPAMATVAALALATILPPLLLGLPRAIDPQRWAGIAAHREGMLLRRLIGPAAADGRVATLAPIVAREGGLAIYREFGAGPFVYRVADYLGPADRAAFTTTSPRDLARFLDAAPSAAIVTGREPRLDTAFTAYAASRGYVMIHAGDPRTVLWLPPARSRPAAAPVRP